MKIFMNNTRDLALCRELKADELRVWAGILSTIHMDMGLPPRGLISTRCEVRTSTVTKSIKTLTQNGFIMDTDPSINPKYVSLEDKGYGSVPFRQEFLKDFSRNRTLHADGLRLFYYLLGDIRLDSKVYDTSITSIAKIIGSDRANTSRRMSQLREEGFITSHISGRRQPPFGRKYIIISPFVLGLVKRS